MGLGIFHPIGILCIKADQINIMVYVWERLKINMTE
jgi:hypothetical protein